MCMPELESEQPPIPAAARSARAAPVVLSSGSISESSLVEKAASRPSQCCRTGSVGLAWVVASALGLPAAAAGGNAWSRSYHPTHDPVAALTLELEQGGRVSEQSPSEN